MKLRVNDIDIELQRGGSITDLLHQLEHDEKGIAVAINNEVVPRDSWSSRSLNEHDKVLIIQATQGG